MIFQRFFSCYYSWSWCCTCPTGCPSKFWNFSQFSLNFPAIWSRDFEGAKIQIFYFLKASFLARKFKLVFWSPQTVNVARFARNVEWDFFYAFQTPCKTCLDTLLLSLEALVWYNLGSPEHNHPHIQPGQIEWRHLLAEKFCWEIRTNHFDFFLHLFDHWFFCISLFWSHGLVLEIGRKSMLSWSRISLLWLSSCFSSQSSFSDFFSSFSKKSWSESGSWYTLGQDLIFLSINLIWDQNVNPKLAQKWQKFKSVS